MICRGTDLGFGGGAMTTQDHLSLQQRRERVLQRLDEGHKVLQESLEGIDPGEAFLGSRWSVWEVLNHLDAENYVTALEEIAAGTRDMLPPFTSREEKFKADVAHLDETYRRLRNLAETASDERMGQPVTPPNPYNSFPGLTLLELLERSSGHASSHARQIVETRKYVKSFSARKRAVTFIVLDPNRPSDLGTAAIGLLKYADYVAGEADALSAVHSFSGGVELTLSSENTQEIVSRLGREARAGIWGVICTIGSPSEFHGEVLRAAEKHCDKVVMLQAGK